MKVEKLIVKKTDWLPLTDIGSATSAAMKKYWSDMHSGELTGVYQISLERPKELIHPEIGYIGKSSILHIRLYELSLNARSEKSNHHNCGRYLRQHGIDTSQVYFRVLFTKPEDYSDLEVGLQNQMRSKFGYSHGFKWTEATAGVASTFYKFKDVVRRLDVEELYKALNYINSEIIKKEVAKLVTDLK